MASRREKQISRSRSFLKKTRHSANRVGAGGDLWSRPAKSRAKSSEAKSSKFAGQLAPTNMTNMTNMIAMIEPHAGATCASGLHQNVDDDACHGGAPAIKTG
jgi:hypothetical protein